MVHIHFSYIYKSSAWRKKKFLLRKSKRGYKSLQIIYQAAYTTFAPKQGINCRASHKKLFISMAMQHLFKKSKLIDFFVKGLESILYGVIMNR